MKIVLRIVFVLLVGISFLGCRHLTNIPPTKPGSVMVGAAEIDVTPPIGHRMAGYFDERLATGVHDPLKAKAIVLQHRDQQIALVFCDLVGVSLNVTTNARSLASQQTGIPYSHIVIS